MNEAISAPVKARGNVSIKKLVKIALICLVALAILAGAAIGGLFYFGKSTSIPTEQAVAAAIADAGLDPAKTVYKCHLGIEEGMFCYEIKLYSGGAEYEYTVHSATGVVLEKDIDLPGYGHDDHDGHYDHDD